MGLGNNIGSRTTQQWKGLGRLYQSNQNPKKAKSDPKGKLVIQNFDRDITSAVFYGWDLIDAAELEETYIFQLANRANPKLRVYINLGRIIQQPDIKYPETFYQCYMYDDEGNWDKRVWLNVDSINYNTFWNMIESVVDEYHPILPF